MHTSMTIMRIHQNIIVMKDIKIFGLFFLMQLTILELMIDNLRILVYNIFIIYLKGQKMDDADIRSIKIN